MFEITQAAQRETPQYGVFTTIEVKEISINEDHSFGKGFKGA